MLHQSGSVVEEHGPVARREEAQESFLLLVGGQEVAVEVCVAVQGQAAEGAVVPLVQEGANLAGLSPRARLGLLGGLSHSPRPHLEGSS